LSRCPIKLMIYRGSVGNIDFSGAFFRSPLSAPQPLSLCVAAAASP
jgi:hypothetical protein